MIAKTPVKQLTIRNISIDLRYFENLRNEMLFQALKIAVCFANNIHHFEFINKFGALNLSDLTLKLNDRTDRVPLNKLIDFLPDLRKLQVS